MATFSDEYMNRLFENFVLEYYRHNFSKLSAYPDQISWDITNRDTADIDFLPTVKTDITLHNGDCTLDLNCNFTDIQTQLHNIVAIFSPYNPK